MKLYIFTDGASKGNPGPGGWGAVIVREDSVYEVGGRENNTTNNRMELSAAIGALDSLSDLNENSEEIVIFSDSSYLINGITKWIFGWIKNGWKSSNKQPVLNVDLWQELKKKTDGKKISWKYVPGHSDVAGNERANDIAEEFAFQRTPELFSGKSIDYSIRLLDKGKPLNLKGEVSSLKKESAKKGKNQKAFSYVSLVGGEIKIHKTWEDCKARVSGKSALFKKALSKEEESAIVEDFKKRI